MIKNRNKIINKVFKYVEKQKNKQVFLLNYDVKDYRATEEGVITHIYKKIFIENEILLVEYEFGEGYEPCEYETAIAELQLFSMDEIYEIIKKILPV